MGQRENLARLFKRKLKMAGKESPSFQTFGPEIQYPPSFSEERLFALTDEIKDWQLNNGSFIKLVKSEQDNTVLSQPIGVSLFPTPFPKASFDDACDLQCIFQELYIAIAADEKWLEETIRDLIEHDRFTAVLWEIHQRVKHEGYAQDLVLGIFRSDYMLSEFDILYPNKRSRHHLSTIKQVEFQTYSCAGGTHGNRISNMHRHMSRIGANVSSEMPSHSLPACGTVDGIVRGLSAAHRAYQSSKTGIGETGILMVVDPFNVNVADERPIEYAIWNQDPSIPVCRVIFGKEFLYRTELDEKTRALIYTQSNGERIEISVVYQRAGINESDYYADGIEARYRMEKSAAIKCPSILSHISGFKKVQQALAVPGTLERFLSSEKAARVRRTFVPLYPMDRSEEGVTARKMALGPDSIHHILKPSLEGGGHNIYGRAIPDFLKTVPQEHWSNYILMEVIKPPKVANILMSPRELYSGSVISELGVFGVCIWRQCHDDSHHDRGNASFKVELNKQIGFSFKTKSTEINEMSVIKGYGCFDTPLLVNMDTFCKMMDDS